MKLIKAMATVAGMTGLSRIAGFVRDILTAIILGAGPIADAFFVALKLPNLFRRITAEGAFSVSFVPIYSKTLENEGEEQANKFAGNALSVMFFTLLGVSLLFVLLMPYVVYLIAPGFQGDAVRYPLTVDMARITFFYMLLMSLGALLGGVLNAHERFAPFAGAPILFNLSLILFLLISGMFENAGYAMSWGVLSAGFLQCGMLWHFVRKYGIRLRIKAPDFKDEKFRRLLRLMGPGVIGAGVMQINLFADLILASFLPSGSISYLYYADRLNQLPLGVVGIAVGTALLPMLSKAMAAEDKEKSSDLFNKALEVCLMLALPAAVGLFIAAQPIIVTLFAHGAFSLEDAKVTAMVLMAYAAGMPAYVCAKVFSTSYWAQEDTTTPVKASIKSTAFNIVVSVILITVFKTGVVGIAIGTALAGWLQVYLLARGLKGRVENAFSDRLRHSLKRIVFGCGLMAAFLYCAVSYGEAFYMPEDEAFQPGMPLKIAGLGALIGISMLIYGVTLLKTGVLRIKDIGQLLRKSNNNPKEA